MKYAEQDLGNNKYVIVDSFDPADKCVMSLEQVLNAINSGVNFYGITKRHSIRVFKTIRDLLDFDNLKRRLANQPHLYYRIDYDDIVLNGADVSNGSDLIIPEFVTSIDLLGWLDGLDLNSVVIPDSVLELSSRCFAGVHKIGRLVLSNNLTYIPTECFCCGLDYVEIPESVRIIGNSSFAFSGLRTLVLHDGLEEIEGNAFEHTNIESLTIPKTVTDIGNQAFYGTEYLRQVNVTRRITLDVLDTACLTRDTWHQEVNISYVD